MVYSLAGETACGSLGVSAAFCMTQFFYVSKLFKFSGFSSVRKKTKSG
jgi:hypothetical protein